MTAKKENLMKEIRHRAMAKFTEGETYRNPDQRIIDRDALQVRYGEWIVSCIEKIKDPVEQEKYLDMLKIPTRGLFEYNEDEGLV